VRLRAPALCAALLTSALAAAAPSDQVDLSSAGAPTITGSVGGSVSGTSDLLSDLEVTVNFGEVSPFNRNAVVRVNIPVAVRSNTDYELRATVTGGGNPASPQALQLSDVGVGLLALQPMASARICSNHQVMAPFGSDPATSVTFAPRATYPASLANIGTASTVLLRGPALSKGANISRRMADNGWRFNLVLALTPQFYAPGTTSITVRFTIAPSALNINCL
jgi:hypothetical protein